jgi:predicted alpha/beta superfamily hydrolase
MRSLLFLLAFLLLSQPVSARPYTLPDTQVLKRHSTNTGAAYELFIATPPGYREAGRTYPVVYMLDADYSFALVRNIVRHFVEREDMPPVILVAGSNG